MSIIDPAGELEQFLAARGFDHQARAAALAALAATTAPAGVPWEKFRGELLEQYQPALRAKASACRSMEHAMRVLEGLGVQSTADLNLNLLHHAGCHHADPKLSQTASGHCCAACNAYAATPSTSAIWTCRLLSGVQSAPG